ncbi:hypothetical protein BD408DRAFT_154058 [Parasitella parasitica]|nr:hypothetical protein BD408DRAFT_154058 [Parasitella parasitica]
MIETFLEPIMKEADKLAQHGLVVMKNDMRVCLSHVYILIAGGDLPAAGDLCNHFGFNSKYGCRICRTETTNINHHTCFLERIAAERHINDFKHPDPANHLGIKSKAVFSDLVTLNSPYFVLLDSIHLVEHNISKAVYDLITLSLNKDTNKASKFMFTMKGPEYMSCEAFPFWIDRKALIEAGKLVAASKPTVNSSFGSKWVDPIAYNSGIRACDRKLFLLHILPAFFVPLIQNDKARKAILKLVKACALCPQWNFTKQDVERIRRHFQDWMDFLLAEVKAKAYQARYDEAYTALFTSRPQINPNEWLHARIQLLLPRASHRQIQEADQK